MHRFITPNLNFQNKTLSITDPKEIHHLIDVLRLRTGDVIAVFNGKGKEVQARIVSMTPGTVLLEAVSQVRESSVNPVTLTLACAIPKKAKFEMIIEKCTELGVDRIIPVLTERTEVRVSGDRLNNKQQRYEKVAVNAAKQCQRNFLPIVDNPTDFPDIIHKLSGRDAAFIPCLSGKRQNIIEAFILKPEQNNVIFFIGPEGDFTPKELTMALKAGCIPVTLGPTVLKVDTAAIAATAAGRFLLEKNHG